jgi:O-antigen/teichoic acid export membrane protein
MSIAQLIHPIPYFGWILGSLITYMAYEIIVQIARGIGQTKLFIISGILSTFLTASISIALVIGFKMDIQAVFFANIVARIFCIILIEYRIHFLKEFFNSATQSAEINKIMLRYALPLLPNFILFWFIDNSSRIFINQYLGIEQNGLYAIIIKFPNILLTFSFIFYQTWQEMAIKFYDSPDRNQFFSNIFNQYAIGLSLAVVMIGFGIKSIFPFIVDSKYQVGIIYIYPLLVAVVFNSLAFFMDMSYQCSKQSSKSLPSIISTAILSVFLNYILVKHFGMMGVVYALILSYIFLTIFRVVDSRKIIPITIKKESIFAILILISGWFLNITPMKSYLSITIAMISFCVFSFIFGKPLLSNFLKK